MTYSSYALLLWDYLLTLDDEVGHLHPTHGLSYLPSADNIYLGQPELVREVLVYRESLRVSLRAASRCLPSSRGSSVLFKSSEWCSLRGSPGWLI